MAHDTGKTDCTAQLSRRALLRAAAAALGGSLAPTLRAQHTPPASRRDAAHTPAEVASPPSAAADTPAVPKSQTAANRPSAPWWLQHPSAARVVEMRSSRVLRGSTIDARMLARLLDGAVTHLTHAGTPSDAWRAILGSAKHIVLKFNGVAADAMQSTVPMADALLRGLKLAGYDLSYVTIVEGGPAAGREHGTRTAAEGWGRAIPVADQSQPVATYWYEADAVINVPFLKTHQVAGMSCAMKNVSHAVIRHPARCHANGCAPYVGQIIGHPEISSRLCLNLVNALRIVIRNGPDATEGDLVDYGGVIAGFDPLAVDVAGLEILSQERRRHGEKGAILAPTLMAAERDGVGRAEPEVLRDVLEGER